MRKTLTLMLSLVVILAMVLSACGPAATPTPVPQPTKAPEATKPPAPPTATPVPLPTATPAPKAVDTVVIGMAQEPDTLFAGIGSMMAKTLVLQAIFPGAVTQDDKANWVPILADKVPTLDNGGAKFVGEGADRHLEVTFKYAKPLKWHDGTPVTAKDQVYGWKLFMDPDFPYVDRTFLYKLYDVVAVDDQTWKAIFLSENQALQAAAGTLKGSVNFAAYKADYGPDGMGYDSWKGKGPVVDPLYFTADFAMPEHILGKMKAADMEKSDFAKKPIYDGAYKVKEWKAGQEIVLEAVPDHPLAPKIKNVIFRFVTDASAEIAALQKGELDAATQIGLEVDSAPELDKLAAAGQYKVFYTPGYQWEHIDLNTTAFPFDDVKVRKALAYAIDKKEITDKLYYGKVKAANSWLPDFHWAYDAKAITIYEYSVDKAKALLKEAGWDVTKTPATKTFKDASGKDVTKTLEFKLSTTDRKDRQTLAQLIAAQVKKAGFQMNMEFLYARSFFGTCAAGGPLACRTYQAGMYTWLSSDDPGVMTLYTCKSTPTKENGYSGQNYPGICDKKLDELLTKGETDAEIAIDRTKRKPIYVEAQKIWTDLVPVIPLKANANVTVARVGLKNFSGVPTSSGETWNIHTWELVK